MSTDKRLARLEQALAAAQSGREASLRTAFVTFVLEQPASDQAAFWRCNRRRYHPGDKSEDALALCGGTFTVTADDEATHRLLIALFFGDDDHPPAIPHPAPPALELA